MPMEPRISIITLGVRDLDRALRFYRDGLGFPTRATEGDGIVFFSTGGVRRREEVAEVLALAERAGGEIVKPAQDVFWGGHSGYFRDPDGHPWEVAWNPHFGFDDAGAVLV